MFEYKQITTYPTKAIKALNELGMYIHIETTNSAIDYN